jgi:hypothetical protein
VVDLFSGGSCEVFAAVVIVNVAFTGLPAGITELGDKLHAALAGRSPQLSLTVPVNGPPTGVTVT